MKIININYEKDLLINYIPLFIYQNYIYIVKRNLTGSHNHHMYRGMYRYNMTNNQLENIKISSRIDNYYFEGHKIYYVTIEKIENEYFATFFEVENKSEKRLVKVKLQGYTKGDSMLSIQERVDPFVLRDGFVGYLYDESNELCDERYNHLYDKNEFKIYIYDTNKEEKYELQDKQFCKHGFKSIELFKFNGEEYLLFNSALYIEEDKFEYCYEPIRDNPNYDENFRGTRDSIYLVKVEEFINEIKQGKKSISYKEVESIGVEGTVRVIKKLSDYKILYKVNHFDKGYFELVIYDMSTNQYKRTKIENCTRVLGASKDAKLVYGFYVADRSLIELSGENYEKRRKVNMRGELVGVMESKYIFYNEFMVVDGKGAGICNMCDINSSDVLQELPGEAAIFEEENIVVLY